MGTLIHSWFVFSIPQKTPSNFRGIPSSKEKEMWQVKYENTSLLKMSSKISGKEVTSDKEVQTGFEKW